MPKPSYALRLKFLAKGFTFVRGAWMRKDIGDQLQEYINAAAHDAAPEILAITDAHGKRGNHDKA